MRTLALLGLVLLTGCMNLTTRVQPENPDVKPILEGSDCVPIILGIGIGNATIDEARRRGRNKAEEARLYYEAYRYNQPLHRVRVPVTPISKIRRIDWSDYQFLGMGSRCVEVVGEP